MSDFSRPKIGSRRIQRLRYHKSKFRDVLLSDIEYRKEIGDHISAFCADSQDKKMLSSVFWMLEFHYVGKAPLE